MKVLGRTNNNKSVLPKDEITELLPTKTSQLTNDSNFITTIPSEYITEDELTTELNNKQDKLVSSTNIKTINNTSILGSGNITTPNTTYSEITETEITAGTSSTSRAISGRRSQEIVNKARTGLVEGNANANNIVSNIFIGTQAEYDALPDKTGILAIIKE